MQALSACLKVAAACSLPCCIRGADLLLPVLTPKLNRAHKGFGDLMLTPTLAGNLRSGGSVGRLAGGHVPQQERRHVRSGVAHLPLRLQWCPQPFLPASMLGPALHCLERWLPQLTRSVPLRHKRTAVKHFRSSTD